MPEAAVLHELLAVIGGHDDDRVVVQAERREPVQQLAEMLVEIADLAFVELVHLRRERGIGVARFHARDGLAVVRMLEVRIVRIHVVEKQEEA